VVDDVGAGGEVGRHEDVGPVPRPPRVVLVVVRPRRDPLQPLRVPAAAGARVPVPHRRARDPPACLAYRGVWVLLAGDSRSGTVRCLHKISVGATKCDARDDFFSFRLNARWGLNIVGSWDLGTS
jgi:hypothetical protein